MGPILRRRSGFGRSRWCWRGALDEAGFYRAAAYAEMAADAVVAEAGGLSDG